MYENELREVVPYELWEVDLHIKDVHTFSCSSSLGTGSALRGKVL